MNQFDGSLQHHVPTADGKGHYTFARCESCMYGSHFETVTWHSWAGAEDKEGMKPEDFEAAAKQKCACDCAGPREGTQTDA